MKKTVFFLVFMFLLFTEMLPQNAIPPASGDGSIGNPYTVESLENLYWIAVDDVNWDKHYLQTANIDASETASWFNYHGWIAIGAISNEFTGSYDGQAYTIEDLYLNYPENSRLGLFGSVMDATLKNIRLTNVHVTGASNVGGLAGEIDNSYVENVIVSGTITGLITMTGGVFGSISGGLVHRVNADVSVQGHNMTGGIAGYITNHAEFRHCYSTGSVTGTNDVGGFAGQLMNGQQFISDSYSNAEVSGENQVGGFVGFLWAGKIYRSYSTGLVIGTGEYVGGLIGYGTGNVYNSFWDTETSGQQSSAGGAPGAIGKTTAEMKQQSTYKYFNFNTLWRIDGDYPYFKDFSGYAALEIPDLASLEGNGTEIDPYLIHNANELAAMHQGLEAHYRLENDIDLTASVIWNYGKGWLPVGSSAVGFHFKGTLDGNEYTISNMTINLPRASYTGLFAYLEQAQIERLSLTAANCQSNNSSGLIAGSIINSNLDQIELSGINIALHTVGGLAGILGNSQISRIQTNCLILGGNRTGGITGVLNNGSSMQFSASYGEVIGEDYVGGLIGEMSTGSPQVNDCYSRAATSGANRVGGLIGSLAGAVNNAYSTGLVTGTASYTGGLAGYGANAFNSFWDMETSGQNVSSAGVGKTTAEMKMESTFTDAGWDFIDIWSINSSGNDGYPQLLWELLVANSELSNDASAYLVPSPSNGSFKIQFNEIQQFVNVYMMDLSGKTVYRQSFTNVNEIPVLISAHSKGLYFVRIETANSNQVIKTVLF